MKTSRFTEAQIAFVLRQAKDGTAIGEVCRRAGIIEATFYNWWKKYAGLMPSEMKRLKQLEEVSRKRFAFRRERRAQEAGGRSFAGPGDVAGRARKKVVGLARRRVLIDEVRAGWKVSIRRACRVLRTDTSTYHYKGKRASQAGLTRRIKEIAETRVRYGYRRIHVLLRREGWAVNAKRIYRLYKGLDLQLRNKTPERRVKAKLRDDRHPAVQANETWAMGFGHDQFATGRNIRVLTVVDTFTWFSPAIEPRFGFRAADVVEVLERIGRQHGSPKAIRVNQGTEFVSRDLDVWAFQRGVRLDLSRPGKPTDNALVGSLNGKFRAERLNVHWFMSLDDARVKCEAWRRDYNEVRPHSAIGNKPPIMLLKRLGTHGPT